MTDQEFEEHVDILFKDMHKKQLLYAEKVGEINFRKGLVIGYSAGLAVCIIITLIMGR